MKASDHIRQVQELIDLFGDCDILVRNTTPQLEDDGTEKLTGWDDADLWDEPSIRDAGFTVRIFRIEAD